MSREQNAVKYHSINSGNKSFESVANFLHLRANLTNEIAFTSKLRAD
jgi:hypothetical protein